jgi:hypothetical protein
MEIKNYNFFIILFILVSISVIYFLWKNNNKEEYTDNNAFCTCQGMRHQNCLSPADKLKSYKNGLTELSVLPKNNGWTSIMPYDIFEEMPEKDKNRSVDVPSFV